MKLSDRDLQILYAAGLIAITRTSDVRGRGGIRCMHEMIIQMCTNCWPVAQNLLQQQPRPLVSQSTTRCARCGTDYDSELHFCPNCAPKSPLVPIGISPDGRTPMPEIMLRFAEHLADRSTCKRLQVGAVVTDQDLLQVLGIGYNGNASGLANTCDSDVPGECGCLHAEINALLKAPGVLPGKHLFVSSSPCVACAKAAINARVACVFFRETYRNPTGLEVLQRAGVQVKHLPVGWWEP